MQSRHRLLALALAALACGGNPPAEVPPPTANRSTITGRDWVLIALGEQTALIGAREQPLTLRLDTASIRAAGFAGCNRYSASYTLRGDSLTFGPVIATKMFCAESNDLERTFLAVLSAAATYQLSDSLLIVRTSEGVEARFR